MNEKYENKLFSTVFQSFALQRSGATRFLKNQKCWTLDGELVDRIDHRAMFPAYVIQELMVPLYKNQIEFVITGNSEIDIAHTVHAIVKFELQQSKFNFRCWMFNKYIDCAIFGQSGYCVIFDCTGRPFIASIQKNRGKLPILSLSDDDNTLKALEIEKFTGYMDRNFVPIVENDVVLLNDELFVIKSGLLNNSGWELSPLSKEGFSPYLLSDSNDKGIIAGQVTVLGSKRIDQNILEAIKKMIEKK